MYCPNCGAYNEDSYNNCTSCGRYIGDINKCTEDKKEDLPKDNATPDTQQIDEENNEQKSGNFFSDYEKYSKASPQNNESFEKPNFKRTESTGYYSERKRNIYTQYTKLPKDYFIFSIICAVLGSMIFGLAAVVFSVMTKAENAEGNIKRAAAYSVNAKRFCIISVVIGVIKYAFILFFISFVFGLGRYYFYPMW